MRLFNDNNMESMKHLQDNSVDSVITDPPYGLSFMNKKWDYDVPSIDFWKEVYRVLKPGGHIISFGGTRTYHRMVVNIEDAGFEIRDQIQWIYGSGFPKSLNIGKADINITKGQSEYEGWGTALKPANEPIVLARKPLSEKSISENVLRWRTGGLNIDRCRIGFQGDKPNQIDCKRNKENQTGWAFMGTLTDREDPYIPNDTGRFPANVILECICDEVIQGESHFKMRDKLNGKDICKDAINYKIGAGVPNYDYNDKGDIHTNPDCPCYIMDEQSGLLKGDSPNRKPRVGGHREVYVGTENNNIKKPIIQDKVFDGGGASRFFYRAKVSKKERNLGLDDKTNKHPTLKPINLLTYLCRLITPPNGVVLDPFMGSGSTGVAALLEGFDFIGMELEKDYYEVAQKRIENYKQYESILKKNK